MIAGNFRRPPNLIMVNILTEKPSVFKSGEVGDVYYCLSDDNAPYAYAALNFTYAPVAILHVEVKRFTHNTLKQLVNDDWEFCLKQCREHDCTMISVTKMGGFESNSTWMKFIRHFGFDKFSQYTGSTQIIGS
jgi:hypothetical protein